MIKLLCKSFDKKRGEKIEYMKEEVEESVEDEAIESEEGLEFDERA